MFKAIFADEALEQLENLEKIYQKKAAKAIRIFENLGQTAKTSRNLDDIWEIKADNIRIYFDYHEDKIIIIGLIVLKKSQKAPRKFIEQAKRNIEKVKEKIQNGEINYA